MKSRKPKVKKWYPRREETYTLAEKTLLGAISGTFGFAILFFIFNISTGFFVYFDIPSTFINLIRVFLIEFFKILFLLILLRNVKSIATWVYTSFISSVIFVIVGNIIMSYDVAYMIINVVFTVGLCAFIGYAKTMFENKYIIWISVAILFLIIITIHIYYLNTYAESLTDFRGIPFSTLYSNLNNSIHGWLNEQAFV